MSEAQSHYAIVPMSMNSTLGDFTFVSKVLKEFFKVCRSATYSIVPKIQNVKCEFKLGPRHQDKEIWRV